MKPTGLQYGVEERPPLGVMLGSAVQHWMLGLASLAFPLLVIDAARRSGQVTPDQVHSLLMMSYLALGASTALQAWRGRWVGSGYLIPTVFTAAFLQANLAAVEQGGLGLVFGMTLFAGAAEIALALLIRRYPQLFPPEAAGVIVLLVGLVLGMVGIRLMFSLSDAGGRADDSQVASLLAGITLLVSVVLAVWFKGTLRSLSVMIGMVAGTLAGLLLLKHSPVASDGGLSGASFVWPVAAPVFSVDLIFPYLAAALVCALRAVGDVTIAQRINDTEWKRPEPKSVCNGVVADGLGNMTAGALGAVGLNTFSGSVGLSQATGITSRRVGFVLAGVYVLAALIPGLADLAMIIPRPVLGAALLLSACFILTNAMQAIVSQALDNRKILVVSLAFFFGLSQHFYPAIFSDLPGPLRQLLNSELTVGVMVLVLLVPLFRWGTRRGMTTELRLQGDQHLAVAQFIEQAAARLGARTDMMHRAIAATTEFIELAPDLVLDKGAIQLAASFDDFILRIDIRYQGQPLALTRSDADKPDIEAFMNDSDLAPPSLHRLSLLLMTRLCDELKWSHSGQDCQVNLRFR